MSFFIASLVVLVLGPLFYRATQSSSALVSAIDGFVFVGIGGLVLVHILPESLEQYGFLALFAACIGLFGPLVFEHFLHHLEKEVHLAALFLAIVGLAVHAFADGIILSGGHADTSSVILHSEDLFPLAVVLHRLPEGLTVWWLLRPLYGVARAATAIALVGLATGIGFFLGPTLSLASAETPFGIFQALMVGALLHVVIHRPHPFVQCCEKKGWQVNASAGAGLALLLLFGLSATTTFGNTSEGFSRLWHSFLALAQESAPALILAYAIAGLVHALLPGAPLAWMKKGTPFAQSLRGLFFGLPLPICSCGVLPIYRSLVLQGVPASAAMAFLVATPELGLDSILLSLPLLGGPFALLRILAASLVAVAIGWTLGKWTGRRFPHVSTELALKKSQGNLLQRLREGFRIGFGEMVDTTAPWILLGLAIAAAIDTSVGSFGALGSLHARSDLVDVPILALLGIPAYVCASGATPLVAILIGKGISPGAGLAFLLTGPATNATTFGILSQLHGRKVALGFGASIAFLAIALGYSVNFLFPSLAIPAVVSPNGESPPLFKSLSLVALGGIFLLSFLRQGPRDFVGQIMSSASHGDKI